MNFFRRLTRNDIVLALAIKLAALWAIWFFFVRDYKIHPTAASVFDHLTK